MCNQDSQVQEHDLKTNTHKCFNSKAGGDIKIIIFWDVVSCSL